MRFYNTLTRKVEEFIPNESNKVKFYTCGPTVYHDQHIGNMRNYIGHDILDKTLRYLGYDVYRVMNITDVGHLTSDADFGEDKMVKKAKEENKGVLEIASYYTQEFFNDLDSLNIRVPDVIANATDYINDYIKIIEKLLDKGYAYKMGGNVYFDTSKLDDYYKLTNHKEEELEVGVRDSVSYDDNKKNQTDFVLWFTKSKFDKQELKWDSPFGVGYPGWHIECSGISMHYCGEYLDIHGGGVDNIFPHHTNEMAQSEAYLGHRWCNYWFHNEHLMDESGKMSKSKGAVLTVKKLIEEGYDPLAFRYMCLASHYRKQLVFSYDNLDNASSAYQKLKKKIGSLKKEGKIDEEIVEKYDNKFREYLSDDLITSNVLSLIYELLKDEVNDVTKRKIIENFDKVLSLDLLKEDELDKELIKWIEEEMEKRKKAKENKDFELADKIRNELLEKGIVLKDTKEKTIYERIK